MKAMKVLTAGIILGLTSLASAQDNQCPNLAGNWQGSCTVSGEAATAAQLGLAGTKETESTVTIEQGTNGLLPCGFVKVDERKLHPGGLKSEALANPAPQASAMMAEASRWEQDELKVTTAGIIKVDHVIAAYVGNETYKLDGADRLVTSMEGKSDLVNFGTQCTYTRM